MIIIRRLDKRHVETIRMYNLDRNINPGVISLGQIDRKRRRMRGLIK